MEKNYLIPNVMYLIDFFDLKNSFKHHQFPMFFKRIRIFSQKFQNSLIFVFHLYPHYVAANILFELKIIEVY